MHDIASVRTRDLVRTHTRSVACTRETCAYARGLTALHGGLDGTIFIHDKVHLLRKH